MRLFILGATGSIGTQTFDIIRNSDTFEVVSVTGYKNVPLLRSIIEEFHPKFVCCGTQDDMHTLQEEYPNITFSYGEEGLVEAATYGTLQKGDMVVNALVGSAGFKPTAEAIKMGRDIALANKESLVIGGEIISQLVKKHNVTLLPIDSEHSAIFQCLQGERRNTVDEIIITASGGSFRDKTREELQHVTLIDALQHPNWSMGSKITIDSATMMNKGFEVIEAHYLFDMPYHKIKTILHKESIIHSMVVFQDTSVIAQLGLPDMRVPIQYALTYPNRSPYQGDKLDLTTIQTLHFESVSLKRYPLFALAIEAGTQKGLMPATLNAANEAAVGLFLEGKIAFLTIEEIVKDALLTFPQDFDITVDKIIKRDKDVKTYIRNLYN